MNREWILKAVQSSAAEAIARVSEILDRSRLLGEQEWEELFVYGCHLNNLWPDELQRSLRGWVEALAPVNEEPLEEVAYRRFMRALFWSLCKSKEEIPKLDSVESEFWKFPKKEDPLGAAHELAALIVTSRSEHSVTGAMLALSRSYYHLHDVPEFRELMMEVLRWTALNPGSYTRSLVSVVHAVHTEFETMPALTAFVLAGANHLGPFLPFWALFQVDDLVLLELRNRLGIHPQSSDLTQAVFVAICKARLDLA